MVQCCGPAFLIHGQQHASDDILADVDAVVDDLQNNPVSDEEFNRAMTKFRSGLYDGIGDGNRIGLVDALATLALFDDDPDRINRIESEFDVVTPALIQKTAKEISSQNQSFRHRSETGFRGTSACGGAGQ